MGRHLRSRGADLFDLALAGFDLEVVLRKRFFVPDPLPGDDLLRRIRGECPLHDSLMPDFHNIALPVNELLLLTRVRCFPSGNVQMPKKYQLLKSGSGHAGTTFQPAGKSCKQAVIPRQVAGNGSDMAVGMIDLAGYLSNVAVVMLNDAGLSFELAGVPRNPATSLFQSLNDNPQALKSVFRLIR